MELLFYYDISLIITPTPKSQTVFFYSQLNFIIIHVYAYLCKCTFIKYCCILITLLNITQWLYLFICDSSNKVYVLFCSVNDKWIIKIKVSNQTIWNVLKNCYKGKFPKTFLLNTDKVINKNTVFGIFNGSEKNYLCCHSEYWIFWYLMEHINKWYLEPYCINTRLNKPKENRDFFMPIFIFN